MKALSKILTIVFIVAIIFLVITFSINLPIYCRFFYYLQIDALDIPEYSGFDREQIVAAYDAILDYCTGRAPFSAGGLAYSESGESHFADCRVLFTLDTVVMFCCAAVVVGLALADKFSRVKLWRFGGFSPFAIGGVVTLGLSVFVVLACVIDFDNVFTAMHKLLFPGKANWVFDYYADPIIRILPEQFFFNCAVLIFSSIILISLLLMLLPKRSKTANKGE